MPNRGKIQTVASPSELLDMDINGMWEREFGLTIIQTMARLEKAFDDKMELIRAEVKGTRDDVNNVLNEFHSNLNSLTARVIEEEDRISDLEDTLIEKTDQEEA